MDAGIGVNEDTFGGKALGAMTGNGVAVVEMTMLVAAHGLFMAEGEEGDQAGGGRWGRVRSMLVTPDRLASLTDVTGGCAGPVYVISPKPPNGSPVTGCTVAGWRR